MHLLPVTSQLLRLSTVLKEVPHAIDRSPIHVTVTVVVVVVVVARRHPLYGFVSLLLGAFLSVCVLK